MAGGKDYKNTLNLPKTAFPMKGNLPETEPAVLARWEKAGLYAQRLSARAGAEPFVLHDGPPYANGDIHIGHALNKILKDFVVKSRVMAGKRAPFTPGWDCHGLPIEYALMKELKVTKHQVNIGEFRKKARDYARKYVGIQRDQFKRLGVLGDWDNPYLTLEPGYVAAELRVLKKLVEDGYVYRANKPVNWCWSCETALAEAEVEYEQHESPSIFVKFPLAKPNAGETHLVIWTTTPWTLMGNVAVAVHPDFDYAVRKVGNEGWITLAQLPAKSAEAMGLKDVQPASATVKGSQLVGKTYRHPFGLREGKVVPADYVSSEDGTGLVHTAPGFGAEDFLTGRKHGLEVVAPVDQQGKFANLPPAVAEFNGQQVQAANPAVIDKLRAGGHLVRAGAIRHDYPHCWRCHNPIIFRATAQWFLGIEHEGLRAKLLATAGQVDWVPPVGRERMEGMLKTRPDWCLSRQRLWGVPIPALTCAKCGGGWLVPDLIENFASAVESAPDAVDGWFTDAYKQWVPEGFACLDCGAEEFVQGRDILDVWFDSGVSHQGVLKRREHHRVPAEMYLEGSDQHRGWFQVSLITGAAFAGAAPYKSVLTHGFVVDGEGRKMSKSLGNVVAPQQVVSTMGADVLRLWVAASDYREDVRISSEILSQVSEVYRKVRNTLRFCLGNIGDFDPREAVPAQRLHPLDRWMVSQLSELVEQVTAAYDQYAYHKVVKLIHEFCTIRLSNFYLDVVKDPLYTNHPKDARRASIQTALLHLSEALIRMLAPVLPVTAEEAWAALHPDDKESVHLKLWPDVKALPRDRALESDWARLLELRDQAMKEMEKARGAGLIGDSLEAHLEISVRDESAWKFLEPRQAEFATACIVSGIRIARGSGPGEPVQITVSKSSGSKCQRCWMRLPTVGKDPGHPELCGRCVEVVSKLCYNQGLP